MVFITIHPIIHSILFRINTCRNIRGKDIFIQTILHRTTLSTATYYQVLYPTIIHQSCSCRGRNHAGSCGYYIKGLSTVHHIVAAFLICDRYLGCTNIGVVRIRLSILRWINHSLTVLHRNIRLLRRTIVCVYRF